MAVDTTYSVVISRVAAHTGDQQDVRWGTRLLGQDREISEGCQVRIPMTTIRCVLLLLALFTWHASPASAQVQRNYCDASRFNELTNMWKVQPDENTSGIPAGELAAERKVMRRVLEMFQSAFVPTGAAGLVGVNYDNQSQVWTNPSRYGNKYTFTLSHHKIECVNDKPAVLDVSYGNVSVQVNVAFVEEAGRGGDYMGFNYLPRGYYQLKDGIALPKANAEGIQEWNFRDGTTVWWLTRAGGALPFRFVTKREFLTDQIKVVQSKFAHRTGLLAYYQRLLGDATDDVAFVKEAQVPGLAEKGYVFTTLEDRANRIYVTVNPDYYDRSLPKSAPQHILIRLRHGDATFLNQLGNGPRHLESFQKLREIVRANLPELRAMVK